MGMLAGEESSIIAKDLAVGRVPFPYLTTGPDSARALAHPCPAVRPKDRAVVHAVLDVLVEAIAAMIHSPRDSLLCTS
jgi:hypothetical protein